MVSGLQSPQGPFRTIFMIIHSSLCLFHCIDICTDCTKTIMSKIAGILGYSSHCIDCHALMVKKESQFLLKISFRKQNIINSVKSPPSHVCLFNIYPCNKMGRCIKHLVLHTAFDGCPKEKHMEGCELNKPLFS